MDQAFSHAEMQNSCKKQKRYFLIYFVTSHAVDPLYRCIVQPRISDA